MAGVGATDAQSVLPPVRATSIAACPFVRRAPDSFKKLPSRRQWLSCPGSPSLACTSAGDRAMNCDRFCLCLCSQRHGLVTGAPSCVGHKTAQTQGRLAGADDAAGHRGRQDWDRAPVRRISAVQQVRFQSVAPRNATIGPPSAILVAPNARSNGPQSFKYSPGPPSQAGCESLRLKKTGT